MRGIVFRGNRELEIMNFPDPTPGTGEVVIEIKASGMCGSDLKFYRAEGGKLTPLDVVQGFNQSKIEALISKYRGKK